jgi:hypothetical protein
MNTVEKLEYVKQLMKLAESILDNIQDNPENDSLNRHYGYSIGIIKSYLNMFSDNSNKYINGNTSLQEILNKVDYEWKDNSVCDNIDAQDYLDKIFY